MRQCRVCEAAEKKRRYWKKLAEEGAHHLQPRARRRCFRWAPSRKVLEHWVEGLYLIHGIVLSPSAPYRPGAAVRAVDKLRVQAEDDKPTEHMSPEEVRAELEMRNQRLTHATEVREVEALWGNEGLRAEEVVLTDHPIIDTHAGTGIISRVTSQVLQRAARACRARRPEMMDVDIRNQSGYRGAAGVKLRVSDGVDPSRRNWRPGNYVFSPPFECSDVPFVLNATEAVEFSAALLRSDWLRRTPPAHRTALWNALRAKGRTGVVYTDHPRGKLGQLAWFIVFKNRATRARIFKGSTYHA